MYKGLVGKQINIKRRAGVLLHPSSFPGDFVAGDMGHQAYRFIEFLHKHGFKVWQMLPLGETQNDKSPYQCYSAHAGNTLLISIDWLIDKNWLEKTVLTNLQKPYTDNDRKTLLKQAADCFYKTANDSWLTKLSHFKSEQQAWLNDYALYRACKEKFNQQAWYKWPKPIRYRQAAEIIKLQVELQPELEQTYFEQFIFFTQWTEIRHYAAKHHVELFGDMPIFVALDSADVWAERENFLLDKDGEMDFVSGVPPDAFSDDGQRWGNPLYDWNYMLKNDFSWWKKRFESQLSLFDLIRLDHFRGLQACWQIPADDDVAINGHWHEVPGAKLIESLIKYFGDLPLIAEDLGVITDEVIALKNKFSLPGMKVLQFAFDGNANNPHLPHHHFPCDVIYTGTHDNDTTVGWLQDKTQYNSEYLKQYLARSITSNDVLFDDVVRTAIASVSFLAILPMQDVLKLDSSARMNLPGTVGNNWLWRFDWHEIKPAVLEKISHYMSVYQR